MLRALGGGLLLAAGGCGGDDPDGEPTPTPTAVPTPTQGPIASSVPGYLDPEKWAGRTVTVASLGGEYQDAQTAAIFDPFALATGAQVQQQTVDLGELRQQVDQDAVTWDLADIPTEEVLALASADYLTPIDYQRVDRTPLFDEIAMQHAVGAAFFSTVIAHAAATPGPSDWTDFWDVARFPGPRALRRGPIGTLEFALLADGVLPAGLYPLDVERAFRSLDRLKPDVGRWYDNTKEPVALILGGEIAFASTYNVRAETDEARAGVAVQWNGGMLSAESWVVPRGAPNADLAMDLINFASRAIPSADLARLVPYGPVNRDAFALLRPDRLPVLPNAEPHRSAQFIENWNWWQDHRAALTERFDDWLLEEPAPVLGEGTPGADD